MKNIIPYGKHFIDEDDIKAVENVLRYKNLTQGDEVSLFEKDISDYVGSKYAVAFSSWTAGLHAACSVIGITNKSESIMLKHVWGVNHPPTKKHTQKQKRRM